MSKISRIEISFPIAVDLPDKFQRRLCELVGEICSTYEIEHPNRVMWVFGVGSKIICMPMTAQEEKAGKHTKYDDDTLSIEISERERYHAWGHAIGSCKICGAVRTSENRFGACPGIAT